MQSDSMAVMDPIWLTTDDHNFIKKKKLSRNWEEAIARRNVRQAKRNGIEWNQMESNGTEMHVEIVP